MRSQIKSYQKTRSIKKGERVLHGIHSASIVLLCEISVKWVNKNIVDNLKVSKKGLAPTTSHSSI
ncbi:hypothetical protein TSL1_13250 [Sulfurovum sp. TSL1]|nr:hypothetical protein TSL1_13250 [Sulfurovum sp. TSL1]